MSDKIRVLIVDDSALIRKIISDIIRMEGDMEVLDVAKDGEEALKKIVTLKPDIITLDLEMPRMSGMEVLEEVKRLREDQNFQIIVISSYTKEYSALGMDVLQRGANDYIEKPVGDISLHIENIKTDLVKKIRIAYEYLGRNKSYKPIRPIRTEPATHNNFSAIMFGASTGGPKVLYDIITNLPGNIGMPVFVVQHMPSGFTKSFADRMNLNAALSVVEAEDNQQIKDNMVYVAPGGYHMIIENRRIKLDQSPPVHGVRPAVDVLFMSSAREYSGNVIAIVLTGMGKDGAAGIKAVKTRGGYVIAQDEKTSIVYGMPKAAVETGCVDIILPAEEIAGIIMKAVRGDKQ